MRTVSLRCLRFCIANFVFCILAACTRHSVITDGVFTDAPVARKYLASGGLPNVISKNDSYKSKRTLLHNAAIYSDSEVVRVLLEGRANPNILDYGGQTPLMAAFSTREPDRWRLEVIRTLIPVTDLSIKDSNGKTAFEWALEVGSPEEIAAFKYKGERGEREMMQPLK